MGKQRCFTIADEAGQGAHGPLTLTEAQVLLQKRQAVGYGSRSVGDVVIRYKRPLHVWTATFDPTNYQLTLIHVVK